MVFFPLDTMAAVRCTASDKYVVGTYSRETCLFNQVQN